MSDVEIWILVRFVRLVKISSAGCPAWEQHDAKHLIRAAAPQATSASRGIADPLSLSDPRTHTLQTVIVVG